MNISEQLFEALCNRLGIQCERILEAKNERRPDYRILLDSNPVIVEVKQMEMNKDNRRLLSSRKQEKGRITWLRGTGHIRVRNVIGAASPQIRNLTNGEYPSILVIFDNTKGFALLDYEDILNAMYGDEAVNFLWPDDSEPGADVQITEHRFGGKRKMTPNSNRSISAIGLLEAKNLDEPNLILFHNIHAMFRLPYDIAWKIAHRQFTIEDGTQNYQSWREIFRQPSPMDKTSPNVAH